MSKLIIILFLSLGFVQQNQVIHIKENPNPQDTLSMKSILNEAIVDGFGNSDTLYFVK